MRCCAVINFLFRCAVHATCAGCPNQPTLRHGLAFERLKSRGSIAALPSCSMCWPDRRRCFAKVIPVCRSSKRRCLSLWRRFKSAQHQIDKEKLYRWATQHLKARPDLV